DGELPLLAPAQRAHGTGVDFGPVAPPGLAGRQLRGRPPEKDVGAAAPTAIRYHRERLQRDEVPGAVEKPALQGVAHPDVPGRLLLARCRGVLPGCRDPAQQAGARADVPAGPADLVQRLAVAPAALAAAGDLVDEEDVDGDVVGDVGVYVFLD